MNKIDFGLIVAVLLGTVFCLTLLYSVWASAREWSTLYCLSRFGLKAQGKISGRRLRNGGKAARFMVTYQFDVETNALKQPYESEQQVSWRHYRRLEEGTAVEIRYLPAYPEISRMWGEDRDNTVRDGTTIIAVIVVIAVLPIVLLWLGVFFVGAYLLTKENNMLSDSEKSR